ncbi:hypothetical protein Lser_V15G22133 [Lactuca serriola]
MSSHMKMLRNKEFWFSFFVLGLLVIFVNGNNIGDKALKTTLIKTILGDASPQPSTMEYDNPHHDAKLRGVCVPIPSSHCKGTDGACYCCIGPNMNICIRGLSLCNTICS